MSDKIPGNALVLVADGAKAILLRNTGQGDTLSLHEEARLTPDSEGAGPSGSRPQEQAPGQTSEAGFANQLAQHLQALHGRNGFKALVLVADPQTLGQIRGALHGGVAAAVTHSVAKDLTNHPLKDIQAALSR